MGGREKLLRKGGRGFAVRPPRADGEGLAHQQVEGEDGAKDEDTSSPARPEKPAAANNDPFCQNYVLAEQKGLDVAPVRVRVRVNRKLWA